MKKNWCSKLVRIALPVCLIIALTTPFAVADSITGPLTAGEVAAINGAADPASSYGPPPGVRFFEPGPLIVDSGAYAGVYSGPSHDDIDSIMFVVSMSTTSHGSLGLGTVDLLLDLSDYAMPFANTFLSASFGAADFFTGAAAGFPSSIAGSGNGEVNALRFTDTLHAAAIVTTDALDGVGNEDLIGMALVLSEFDLRVDIFGISEGAFVNNTPNSGAIGVTGGICAGCPPPSDPPPSDPPVPEPATLTLLAIGLGGLAARKARKKA